MLAWHSVPSDVYYQLRAHGYLGNVKHCHFGDKVVVSYQIWGTTDDVRKFWFGW